MKYNKIQKIISVFLLFIFFFGQITWLSFLWLLKTKEVLAKDSTYHDLVSIIVDEETYDELDSEIERYAEDIQHYLNNTKVVILPIKEDTSAFSIASMNERLFFEWYKWLKKDIDFESRLVWTVLIWNFPVPVISENWKIVKSIVPYIDFEDKRYIYNPKTKLFEWNLDNINWLKPEIWQWVISPNTWDFEKNIEEIKNFLDKDHDFYKWKNLFDKDKIVLNWNKEDKVPEKYEPYVFYFDQIREQKALNYMLYKWYEAYLKNKEDLVYHRYWKTLNDNVEKIVKEWRDMEVKKALEWIKDPKIINAFKNEAWLDTKNVPDILLEPVIKSSTKKFLEIFNNGTISDFRKNVHNAWRYNKTNIKVNADFAGYLVSVLDEASDKTLKSVNNDIEQFMFNNLKGKAEHLPIPVSIYASEWLPKQITWGVNGKIIDFTNPKTYTEDDIKIRWNWSRIPAEFFMKSASIRPEQVHFGGKCVLIEWIESKWSNFFACPGWAKLFPGKTWLIMKTWVFAQILDIKCFKENGPNWVKFLLATWEKVKMRADTFKKIVFGFSSKYDNFYHGRSSEYFWWPKWGKPWEPIYCTIYRWSGNNWWQLVEANQWFNPRNWEDNAELIKNCIKKNIPFEFKTPKYSAWHWWCNSILNYKTNDWNKVVLKKRDKTRSIEDLYDPVWAQIVKNWGPHPWIKACYDYNYILTRKPINTSNPAKQAQKMWHAWLPWIEGFYSKCYRVPLKLSMNAPLKRVKPIWWTCHTKNQKFNPEVQTPYWKKYVISQLLWMLKAVPWEDDWEEDVPYNGNDWVDKIKDCLINWIELRYSPMWSNDRKLVRASTYDWDKICPVTRYRYHFTSTEGYINHIEPTIDTLNKHLKTKSIPNLPIDRDRYVEIFKWWNIIKIKYPYLFRVVLDPEKDTISWKPYMEFQSWIESFNSDDKENVEIDWIEEFIIMTRIKTILKNDNLTKNEKLEKIANILKKYKIDNETVIYDINKILKSDESLEEKIKKLEKIVKNYDTITDFEKIELKNLYTLDSAKKALKRYLKKYCKWKVLKFVMNRWDQKLKIGWEEKTYNYFDVLAFAVLWNNLPNVSAKYKFVIENYLSDQIWWNNEKYVLPKNKKEYEIAYLWAPWDAKNMYVKMDPEKKALLPYSNIISENAKLKTNRLAIWVASNSNFWWKNNTWEAKNAEFKCAPPEWVPIWEWIPAVICRLKSLLPPKIWIEWVCWSELVDWEDEYDDKTNYDGWWDWGGWDGGWWSCSKSEQYKKEQQKCLKDDNKNWINDCLETRISKLELRSDKEVVSFDSNWNLLALVEDKSWNRVLVDNSSMISFELVKIIDKKTNKVVFDINKDNFYDKKDIINKYLLFNPIKLKSTYWKAKATFSTKANEADVIFRAKLKLKPKTFYTNKIYLAKDWYNYNLRDFWKEKLTKNSQGIDLVSNNINIKIRKSVLNLEPRFIDEEGNLEAENSEIKVNDKTNIYLFAGNKNFEDFKNLNKESLILKLTALDKDWKEKKINFPIKVKITNKFGKVIQIEKIKSLNDLKELSKIKKAWEYKLEVFDNYWFNTLFNFEVIPWELDKVKLNLWTTLLDINSWVSTNLVSLYDKYDNIVSQKLFDYKLKILWDSVVFKKNWWKELNFSWIEWFKAFRLKSNNKEGISKILVDIYKDWKKLKSTSQNIRVIKDLKLDFSVNGNLKVWWNQYKATIVFKDKNWNKLTDLNSRVYLAWVSDYLSLEKPYFEIKAWESKIKFKTKTKAWEKIVINFRVEWFSWVYTKIIKIYPDKPMFISLLATKAKFKASTDSSTKVRVSLRDIYNNIIFTDSSSKISVTLDEKYKKIIQLKKKEIILNAWTWEFEFYATEIPGSAYLKFSIDKDLSKNTFTIGTWENKVVLKWLSDNVIELETFFFWDKNDIVWRKYNALYTTLVWAEYWDFTRKDYLASGMLFDKNNRSLAVTSLIDSPYDIKDIITISSNWLLQKVVNPWDLSQDITLSLVKDEKNRYFINLFNNALNIHIWKIYLNFDNLKITKETYDLIQKNEFNFSDFWIKNFKSYLINNDKNLDLYLSKTKNSFVFYIDSNYYYLRKQSLWNNKNAIIISYKDPFSDEYSLNSFAKESLDTYENFYKNWNIWWKWANKTLLEFASWLSAWESAKKYMWPLVVTLWDPVISLKKIRKKSYGIEKKFDSTLWEQLNQNKIEVYRTFDYNADSEEDILTISSDWYISLLENKDKKFLDQRHLARVSDLWKKEFVVTWDFSWDWYDDIFFVDNKWNPNILNNIEKDFKRYDLTDEFDLKARIIDVKAFDMDADWVDDVVTLDESWKINIFYWQKNSLNFTKNTIYKWYWLKLNNEATNDLSAVYFEWLNEKRNIKWYKNLEDLMFEKLNYDLETNRDKHNYKGQTSFLKWEFAKAVGIDIKRYYKDENWWALVSKDKVKVNLTIKNISNKTIKNIVYAENIPKYFKLDYSSIKVSDKNLKLRKNLWNYKFYIDKFELKPEEEIKVEYEIITRPFYIKKYKYDYMKNEKLEMIFIEM